MLFSNNDPFLQKILETGAIIISVIAGTVIYKYWDNIKKIWRIISEKICPCATIKPQIKHSQQITLAAYLSVEKMRIPFAQNNPYQIFSDAGLRWYGASKAWQGNEGVCKKMSLIKISKLPENNNQMIFISYELYHELPTNRMILRDILKKTQNAGNLPEPQLWKFNAGFVDPALNNFK